MLIFSKRKRNFYLYKYRFDIFTDNNNELVLFSSEEWITKKISDQKNVIQLKPFTGIFLNNKSRIEKKIELNLNGVMSQKSLDEIRNDLMQYNYSQPILKGVINVSYLRRFLLLNLMIQEFVIFVTITKNTNLKILWNSTIKLNDLII